MARSITGVDRMLAWSDSLRRSWGDRKQKRRRTHRQIGSLDVVIIEESDGTKVYLEEATSDGDGAIVECSPDELLKAADMVRAVLANPPPRRRQ